MGPGVDGIATQSVYGDDAKDMKNTLDAASRHRWERWTAERGFLESGDDCRSFGWIHDR